MDLIDVMIKKQIPEKLILEKVSVMTYQEIEKRIREGLSITSAIKK